MAEAILVAPADLLLDEENPRLSQPNVGQNKATQALAKHQGRKLQALAADIVANGLSPSDLPIVIFAPGNPKRYIVLEGNRRLTALKALENPEIVAGNVPHGVLKELRRLSKQYLENPIESVQCALVNKADEAEHWIRLRHTGENNGAGIVRWGADEHHRYDLRWTNRTPPHQQALNWLESQGVLKPEERSDLPTSSFERLINTPVVRDKLGIEVEKGNLHLLAEPKRVAKALMWVIRDLISRKINVGDIYTQPKRAEYAARLPADVIVTPTLSSGHGTPVGASKIPGKRRAKKPVKPERRREQLIPSTCILNTTDPRCLDIEQELRRLRISAFTNAAGVLFRVFLELSADCYIAKVHLKAKDDKLVTKLLAIVSDLETKGKIAKTTARVIRRACDSNAVNLLNDYVHNRHEFPGANDLRGHWDRLQPFVTAMWAPEK